MKIKLTTSALIAAKKKEFLEANMKDQKIYDHIQDDFKNVSYILKVYSHMSKLKCSHCMK